MKRSYDGLLDVLLARYRQGPKPVIKALGPRETLQAKGEHCQEWHWCTKPAGHKEPCSDPPPRRKNEGRHAHP